MRFPLSLTHQTPLVNAIKFDASVTDIAKRWKLHHYFFLQSLYFCFIRLTVLEELFITEETESEICIIPAVISSIVLMISAYTNTM